MSSSVSYFAHILSGGIGMGISYRHTPCMPARLPAACISVSQEKGAFSAALSAAKQELVILKAQTDARLGAQTAAIFSAHLAMLEDDTAMVAPVLQQIETHGKSAIEAVQTQFDLLISDFFAHGDPRTTERAADIIELKQLLLRHLQGEISLPLPQQGKPIILLMDELPVSLAVTLSRQEVAAVIVKKGGYTTHATMIAASLQIPLLVCTEPLPHGAFLIADGVHGAVILNPDSSQRASFAAQQREQETCYHDAQKTAQPSALADGKKYCLGANISLAHDISAARLGGADCVGLVRSEFLFLSQKDMPSLAQQRKWYEEILSQFPEKTVTFRLADFGGDKPAPAYLHTKNEQGACVSGMALLLENPDFLSQQISALLQAAAFGKIQIMLPMVCHEDEVAAFRATFARACAALGQEKKAKIPVGCMIEHPAACQRADALAAVCDFFSIGTNDLVQYTLQQPRWHSENIPTLHPNVLLSIEKAASAANVAHIPCALCGQMAQQAALAPIWLGLGISSLSMHGREIPRMRRTLAQYTYPQCQAAAARALAQAKENPLSEITF